MPNLEPTEHELRREIADLSFRIFRYSELQGAQEGLAADMRRVAGNLEFHVGPLRGVFAPVRSLHTPATWTGNAATQSRTRLDDHETRCNHAISSIDNMIEDLHEQAQAASTAAAGYRSDVTSLRQDLFRVENELEDVYAQ